MKIINMYRMLLLFQHPKPRFIVVIVIAVVAVAVSAVYPVTYSSV